MHSSEGLGARQFFTELKHLSHGKTPSHPTLFHKNITKKFVLCRHTPLEIKKSFCSHAVLNRRNTHARCCPTGALITDGVYLRTNNHSKKHIAGNNLLFLRDQTRLLAIARVEKVSVAQGERIVPTCPVCGLAKIETRKKRNISYLCFNRHQFTEQAGVSQLTMVHTAQFAHECVRVTAPIEPSEIRLFEATNSKHIAPTYIGDEQDRQFQAIGARRGMASFRYNLINRYGARCMISDCDVLAILEACND